MQTIAFIGLGHMGAPMAANLIKAGYLLRVFDLVQSAIDGLVAQGASAARSAHDAVDGADLVITMLPASQHVEGLYLGTDGLLTHIAPSTLVLECSTIAPASARKVHQAAAELKIPMLDAPVSGGTGGAIAGTLTFMVGGEQADFERARPVLAAMGKNIVHCGGTGNGQVAKVANNLLLGISMIGVAEAMSLGVKLGMDAEVLAGIINTSSGRCWSSEVNNPLTGAPAARGYSGGFGTDLMLKDLGLASEAARQVRQPVLLGALAQQLFQTFSNQGNGQLDFSAIVKLYQQG